MYKASRTTVGGANSEDLAHPCRGTVTGSRVLKSNVIAAQAQHTECSGVVSVFRYAGGLLRVLLEGNLHAC